MAPKFSKPERKATHIFLSHNRGKLADGRDNHDVVVTVAKRLEAAAAGTRHFVPPGFAVKMAPKFFMPQGKETHIFLSHNRGKLADGRDNHAIVVAVAKRLEALGFVVWLDDIDMKVCHLEKERERERERWTTSRCMCVCARA